MPKIFVSLHQQSKEQPIVPKTGHLWRPGRGLNDGRRRSSMKTRNRGTERGAFRVVVIQRTLKHRTEYEVYEEGNLENGDFISGHFRSWSFPVMVIFGHGHFQLRLFSLYITFFAAFLYKSMKFFIILAYNSDFLSKFAKDMLHSASYWQGILK